MIKQHLLLISILVSLGGHSHADLGIEDPTKPVYVTSNYTKSDEILKNDTQENSVVIPPLSQLIFSSKRKVAIFGDTIVMKGDVTDFGKIIDILKDRVLLENSGVIKEIVFYQEDPQTIIN